jgi:hypothetical protein
MNNVDLERTMPIKNSWPCWNCKTQVTMSERADADGDCPHCKAELDIELWPFPENAAQAVERAGADEFEVVGRECIPSAEMAAVPAYKKAPWVDGNILESPSTPGFYRIEPLIRLSDAQSKLTALCVELAETQAISQQEELRANGYATELVAAERRNAELSAMLLKMASKGSEVPGFPSSLMREARLLLQTPVSGEVL